MKKYLFYLFIFVSIFFIIFYILGNIKREGYFKDISINYDLTLKENNITYKKEYLNNKEEFILINNTDYINVSSLEEYIFTNDFISNYVYRVKIDYYTKFFRHSDIFGVYIDIKDSIYNNTFIKDIMMEERGSPYGYLISSEKIVDNNIKGISYYLKLKYNLIALAYIIVLLLYLYSKYRTNIDNFLSSAKIEYISYSILDKYHLNNILFILYIITNILIIFSFSWLSSLRVDDWAYSNNYGSFYNIFKFNGNYWQRGRHFADILMSINMRPFGNIFISLGADPLTTHKIFIALFIILYLYIYNFSISIFIWLLVGKEKFKLIFILSSLYLTYILITYNYSYIDVAAYFATAGISLLIFIPIIFYFLNNKRIFILSNKIFNYALYIFLIYLATFTLETTSLAIAGISFSLLIYFYLRKHEDYISKIDILSILILICISTIIAFLLTLFFSGRGDMQISKIGDSSLLRNISMHLKRIYIFDYFIIAFSFITILYLSVKFIRFKYISKNDYLKLSILLISIIGIFVFFLY